MKHETDLKIFKYGNNQWVTYGDIVSALKQVGADQCDVLLLHTGLTFGLLSKELKRKDLVAILYDAITELGVKTLVFPTFTFSFSNYEDYDIINSRTRMGMLNEYVRKLPEAVRTKDPLMSFCIIGEDKGLAKTTGNRCLGTGSVFDNLHNTSNVKIVFLGTDLKECCTYLHYVEEQLRVPYRYDKEFSGKVIDENGNETQETYILYVKYKDVIPMTPVGFEQHLIKNNYCKKIALGDSYISCMRENDIYNEIKNWLETDVNSFLARPYDETPLIKEYQYGNVTTVQ